MTKIHFGKKQFVYELIDANPKEGQQPQTAQTATAQQPQP